jgi:hypothetical protein
MRPGRPFYCALLLDSELDSNLNCFWPPPRGLEPDQPWTSLLTWKPLLDFFYSIPCTNHGRMHECHVLITTPGPSLCVLSLTPSPPFFTSLPRCPLSSASPLRPSNATMGVSSITPPLAPSSSPAVSSSVCLVRILHHRTTRQSALFGPQKMSCALF